jgi:hypothetical protein
VGPFDTETAQRIPNCLLPTDPAIRGRCPDRAQQEAQLLAMSCLPISGQSFCWAWSHWSRAPEPARSLVPCGLVIAKTLSTGKLDHACGMDEVGEMRRSFEQVREPASA